MIAVIQRVKYATVSINNELHANISAGLLILIGFDSNDSKEKISPTIEKSLHYRIFSDHSGKMNLSVSDIEGGLLLVPQFTLAADTQKGTRPSFSSAEDPQLSQRLFEYFCKYTLEQYKSVETGRFGADMKVSLCNDGPVTFMIQVTDQ